MPHVTAAVTTYGMSTLDKIRDGVVDKASDAGVSPERRIPNQIRKALAADPPLAQEVTAILASAPGVQPSARGPVDRHRPQSGDRQHW